MSSCAVAQSFLEPVQGARGPGAVQPLPGGQPADEDAGKLLPQPGHPDLHHRRGCRWVPDEESPVFVFVWFASQMVPWCLDQLLSGLETSAVVSFVTTNGAYLWRSKKGIALCCTSLAKAMVMQNVTRWSRKTGHTSGGWTAQMVFVSALPKLPDAVSWVREQHDAS